MVEKHQEIALKVAGIDVFSAGQIQAEEGDEEVVLSDLQGGVYRKLVLRDNRLRLMRVVRDACSRIAHVQLLQGSAQGA